LRAHLGRIGAGDILALLGYIQMNEEHEKQLQAVRHAVADKKHVLPAWVSDSFSAFDRQGLQRRHQTPEFFLQVTCDDALNLPVPEQKYTFGGGQGGTSAWRFPVLAEREGARSACISGAT